MNQEPGVRMQWGVVVLLAVGLIAAGAAGTSILMRRSPSAGPNLAPPVSSNPSAAPSGAAPFSGGASLPEVAVTLTDDAVKRAGIEVTAVATSGAGGRVRVPGVVQPNAYRAVTVTSLVGGRVTRVVGELGQQVRRGQTIAEIYSPELAEAQTRYLSSRAELEAHERKLRRTEKLVEIGAASRQELEQVHAEHTVATTMVESMRSRLMLLGMSDAQVANLASASDIRATVNVSAPIDGVITARDANVGLNVEAATPLFTVVDLSNVWVVGDLYERDFAKVHVGSEATVTTTAYPGLVISGRVNYIDPQVSAETRTAKLRVEVPNRGLQLRLGMYADISVGDAAAQSAIVVPQSAVQTIDDRRVVYVVDTQQQGRFIEREVQLGETAGASVQVLAGLKPDDVVASKGTFFIRAERERIAPHAASMPPPVAKGTAAAPEKTSRQQAIRIDVTEKGFEPPSVTVKRGIAARLTFVRRTDNTCATAVTVPGYGITRELPLNTPVVIEFEPKESEVKFTCGMSMFAGRIVVQ